MSDPIKTDWCAACERGWSWVDGNMHRAALEAKDAAMSVIFKARYR